MPFSFSTTATTPSYRPTRGCPAVPTSWVRTTREPAPIRERTVSRTLRSSDWASSTITNASCRDRPRICVSGKHLEHPAVEHLVDDVLRDQRAERVEDRLRPGRHLLGLGAGQVAEFLPSHRVQRPEDHDLAVLAPFQHGLQARAQRRARTCRCRPAAERHDPDLRIEQEVERDPLLGAAAAQAERLAIAADQPDHLVRA